MNATQNKAAIRDLRTLFGAGTLGVLSDGQLLDRFIARRDEPAFEALVLRHSPMVWGVCRRVLRNHHDAEDAFQATFLVLARKASSVLPREMVANWLYGVACQTALKARTVTARRHAREKQVMEMPEPEAVVHAERDELIPLLDQELSRLPDKYRMPIVLCDLEGKTHRDAAFQLGWPIGTLSGRLSRARGLLRKSRPERRGLILPAGSLAAILSDRASAYVSAAVVSSTVRAAGLIATGRAVTSGLVSARVVTLSEQVLKAMLLTRLKVLAAVLAITAATAGLAFQTHGSEPAGPPHATDLAGIVFVAQQSNETAPKPKDARATAEAFATALSEGKLKEAARLCWPEECDEGMLRELKQVLGGAHPSMDSVDVVGDVALALSFKMKLRAEERGDGNSEIEARLLLVLCRKDGDWQIQLIDLGPAFRMERQRLRFRSQFPDPVMRSTKPADP